MWSMSTECTVDLAEFMKGASRLPMLWLVLVCSVNVDGFSIRERGDHLNPGLEEGGGRGILHRGITLEGLTNAQSNLDI
jgi:hypothetical protein